jgi:hypothetical protein
VTELLRDNLQLQKEMLTIESKIGNRERPPAESSTLARLKAANALNCLPADLLNTLGNAEAMRRAQVYIDQEERTAAEAAENTLTLADLSAASDALPVLRVVDSDAAIRQAHEVLIGADCVGLDTQSSEIDILSRVSILQASTKTASFLFDITAIAADDACSPVFLACIGELFASRSVLKVGFDFGGDLKALSASFPSWKPELHNFLPLDEVLKHFQSAESAAGRKLGNGLADMCKLLFGKPLNKHQTRSNWGMRPLSAAQLDYAHLDALCEVHAFERVRSKLTADELSNFALRFNFTVPASA